MTNITLHPAYIDALSHRDAAAWSAFVGATQRYIRACVARALRSRAPRHDADVADVTQDVYLRLLGNDCRLLRRFDPSRGNLSTWLAIIARSTAVDFLRKRLGIGAVEKPLEDEDLASFDTSTESERQFPMPGLSARQNQVMHLLYDHDLDVAEVAQRLAISEQTVRSIRHQSLQRLRASQGMPHCA